MNSELWASPRDAEYRISKVNGIKRIARQVSKSHSIRFPFQCFRLKSGEDDEDDENDKEETAAVGDGVDDRVFVELAARGLEPETHDPKEKNWDEKPETPGVLVELCRVQVGDVEGEDDDRGKAACGPEGAELFDVADLVAATSRGDAAAFAKAFELGEALNQGEGEEEEDAEASQPGGDLDSSGGGAGDDADGVETGQGDNVDQNIAP